MNSLCKLSAQEMRQGLLDTEFSAVELASAHLDSIKESNETLNSFITITEDKALAAAKAADTRLSSEKENSPLLCGLPLALKDMLVTKDVETTCGSKILKGFVPPYTGTAVARAEKQGMVVVGKTNMDEFGMGSSSENSAFGPVRNPWDTERIPGGSSGGSAAAVASGQAPLALGTDTGGSIRQPAAMTGIVGLKPTYGRVSRYGAVAYASSCDQVGPFARNIPDLAMLFAAIAGKDPQDATSVAEDVPDYLAEVAEKATSGLAGLKVGVPQEYLVDGLQPDVKSAFESSLGVFEKLGAEIVDVSLPHTEHALATYYIIVPAEASSNLARYDGVRYGHRTAKADTLQELYAKTRGEAFGKEVKRRIMMGSYVLSAGYYDAYYLKAQQVRTLVANDFLAAFTNHCDVIATPVSPCTAFKLGEKTSSPLEMYLADALTVPVSLAGLPALSIPCGLDTQNLPIGLQLIAPAFEESKLLSTGNAFLTEQPFELKPLTSGGQ